jgi:energy-coupling factor transporter ATP-binding protein EcfA2
MQAVTTIGLDIAKSVFQIHGVDAAGKVIVRRQLKRRYVLPFFQKLPSCLIGIEACASSHHWSRELQALGHTVRLMPPAYVKPYVKRHKNDAADAEAIPARCRDACPAGAREAPDRQRPLGADSVMVWQNLNLFPWRNVIDNVAFGLEMRGVSRAQRYQQANMLIASVGLRGFEHHLPGQLSGAC